MALIKRLFSSTLLFFRQLRFFGFFPAFWSFLYSYSRLLGRFRTFAAFQKHRSVVKYLSGHYASIIDKFSNKKETQAQHIEGDSIIWVCWWDGIKAMPPIVNACYNSIVRHAGDHPVRLISKHTINDFVSIPEFIIEKVNAKIITLTHFSDIIRAAVLSEYGGIWLDATIFVLKNIVLDNMPFFTLKTKQKTLSISHDRWQGLCSLSSNGNYKTNTEINRWSGFILAGAKKSPLFEFMKEFFYAYWTKENNMIDYLLIDYAIALAYDTMPEVKKMIDAVPCSEGDKFALEHSLNTEFSDELLDSFSRMTFHKLSWKLHFDEYTKNKKLTMYGYLTGK